jgi:hypothetical protein
MTDLERESARPRGFLESQEDVIMATDLIGPWAIRAAAALGIADVLSERPCSVAELAVEVGADPGALHRLLRYLTRRGLFCELEQDIYTTTSTGVVLRDDHRSRLRKWLDEDGAGGKMALAVSGLPRAIRTGGPAYAAIFGREFWDDLDHDPSLGTSYDILMGDMSAEMAPEIAKAFDWGKVRHVVDVGGGNGTLVTFLLQRYTDLEATIVEMPRTAQRAEERLQAASLLERCRVIPGNIFDPLSVSGDVYVLSFVLHAFPDTAATQILRRCAEAGGRNSRVMVIECTTDGIESIDMAAHDLRMLTLVGGLERTESQFANLFSRSGLGLISTHRSDNGEVVFTCEVVADS